MPSSTGRVFHFSPFVSIKNPCKTGTDLGEGCRGCKKQKKKHKKIENKFSQLIL